MLNVLERTIETSEVLEAPWEEAFTQLALDNMTKATVGLPSLPAYLYISHTAPTQLQVSPKPMSEIQQQR